LYLNSGKELKSVFDHFCFWQKLLKNFVGCSLFALIHELLNKSINLSKVFGLSLRYSIYKVQGSSLVAVAFASAANFYMLAHRFEFVKHFFQVFSNSF